jgi:hypothetical protein
MPHPNCQARRHAHAEARRRYNLLVVVGEAEQDADSESFRRSVSVVLPVQNHPSWPSEHIMRSTAERVAVRLYDAYRFKADPNCECAYLAIRDAAEEAK